MTTITNYLQLNLVGKDTNELQRPVLVIRSQQESPLEDTWGYVTRRSFQLKSIVVLDFGIKWQRHKHHGPIVTDNGLNVACLDQELKHYLVNVCAQNRQKQSTYDGVCKTIDDLVARCNLTNVVLLVQGLLSLEVFQDEAQCSKLLESLTELDKAIHQINILVPVRLSSKVVRSVERVASCILNLAPTHSDKTIPCQLVVRRYTAYSVREHYTLSFAGQSLKVQRKDTQSTGTESTGPEHDKLGFSLLKSEEAKQQQKQLRNIIYPYLNVQNRCQGCQCVSGQCSEHSEQLISIDDQQEDQDDLDV